MLNPNRMPDDMLIDGEELLAIYLGGSGSSFTGQLLRLIAKADTGNRHRLAQSFPTEVHAWEVWTQSPVPLPVEVMNKAVTLLNEGRSFAILDLR